MPLSFKSRLAKLEHKGQISKEEYQNLLTKLDGHDRQIRIDAIDECIEKLYEVTPQTVDEKLDMVFVNALRELKEQI